MTETNGNHTSDLPINGTQTNGNHTNGNHTNGNHTNGVVKTGLSIDEIAVLPSLDVVAVSQAPSPESNPNSPLPVETMVSQYLTIES